MNLIRKLFTKITRPSLYATCMAVLIFVAVGLFTIFCFLTGLPTSGLICLFISALFLGYGTYAIIVLLMKYWPKLEQWSEGHGKYVNSFVKNYDFRTICTMLLSMAINIGFAVFNAVYGFMYMEWWCISMFIYYVMLIVMRSSISARALTVTRHFDDNSREDAQLRVYRMAAIMMLAFTIGLNFLLWELLSQANFGFRHHLLISIVTGIYTVIKVVLAVSNLIYTRGRHDKITHAVRNINMADAMVSVLTLLMTFLTRFSDSRTAVTTVLVLGTIICVYVAAMALFMLINSVVKLKRNRRTLYELLMDSLNEDFENSLEEPAWEAVFATVQFGSVEYIVESDLALEEMNESMSDGIKDSLENSTTRYNSLLLSAENSDPEQLRNLYNMAGMDKDIPSAPHPLTEDEEEEEDEPTPLPASLMPRTGEALRPEAEAHHDEEDEDGFGDFAHDYIPVPPEGLTPEFIEVQAPPDMAQEFIPIAAPDRVETIVCPKSEGASAPSAAEPESDKPDDVLVEDAYTAAPEVITNPEETPAQEPAEPLGEVTESSEEPVKEVTGAAEEPIEEPEETAEEPVKAVQDLTEESAGVSSESADVAMEESTEEPAEQPADDAAEGPAEEPIEQPGEGAEEPIEEPGKTAGEPIEEPAEDGRREESGAEDEQAE
ncbi:MAG: hypothetical protein LUD50_05335 [Clostridia bacterium]|nr:hypothetical protein [Clostridia bacterium]